MAAETSDKANSGRSVLPPGFYSGGPKGVGDPNEQSLRKVEREILIPKIMRERAVKEKCVAEAAAFADCCRENGLLMTLRCKEETKAQYACLESWYRNEDFKKECTEEYLRRRTEFRESGIKEKMKKKESEMF